MHTSPLGTLQLDLILIIYSHAANSGSIITQLAFSPRENLIAWTDTDGAFTRWPKAIPDTFPDPVKRSNVTNSSATIPTRLKTGPSLFGDDVTNTTADVERDVDDDVDLDAGFGDADEDWIIDDLGGGLQDAPAVSGKYKDGFVKEMGMSFSSSYRTHQPTALQ